MNGGREERTEGAEERTEEIRSARRSVGCAGDREEGRAGRRSWTAKLETRRCRNEEEVVAGI